MAIKLINQENVEAASAAYPYGNIKDDDGTGNGTPLDKLVHADYHQFFARMLAESGVIANGLPDQAYYGFQYYEALKAAIDQRIAITNISTVYSKVILLPAWNMDAGADILVHHDVDPDKIVGVQVIVRDDTDSLRVDLTRVESVTLASTENVGRPNGFWILDDPTRIRLSVNAFGVYKGANWDSTAFSRGKLYLSYIL